MSRFRTFLLLPLPQYRSPRCARPTVLRALIWGAQGCLTSNELLKRAEWYREFAERAGNVWIWAARLQTAEELEAEAARVERQNYLNLLSNKIDNPLPPTFVGHQNALDPLCVAELAFWKSHF